MKTFDIWHQATELPDHSGEEDSYSDDVLIDLDGNRETFRVGWYDFDEHAWMLYDTDSAVIDEYAKWRYLPLVKYEK